MKGKKMRHFEYTDLGTNANKFWEISLEAKKLSVTYGRIGILKPATKTYIIGTTDPKKGFKKTKHQIFKSIYFVYFQPNYQQLKDQPKWWYLQVDHVH